MLDRRVVLRGAILGSVGAAVAGCDLSTEPSTRDSPAGARSLDATEAPQLSDLVERGELPSLAERLPKDPLVVEPTTRTGPYGGQWRTATLGLANENVLYRAIGYDQLMRWTPDFTDVTPNLARELESNHDGSAYVIHLRKGVKWSDGREFTADDIGFVYNDVMAHEDITVGVPSILVVDDAPAVVEVLDDYSISFKFAAPNGLFRQALATPLLRDLTIWPKHYLSQFHGDFDDRANEKARDEGFDGWVELLENKSLRWDNPDLPTVCPWRITQALAESTRVRAERNPYYWKVDPDGRQLPYLDAVTFDVVNDTEPLLIKATNGELDMHVRHFNTVANKPVLARSRESGRYDFFEVLNSRMNQMVIGLNQTCRDPVKREIFRNLDFRIGLSHAINRRELIDVVYQGQGEAWQAAPRPESELFDEELAHQYTEFDVELANSHLDSAGFGERDADGFRLGPDGARIAFDVIVPTGAEIPLVDAVELVAANWREVGVDLRSQPLDLSLWSERISANDYDASVWQGPGGLLDAYFDPRCYFPFSNGSTYALLWANWYPGIEPNEEPPEAAREQMRLYDRAVAATDEAERVDLFKQLLRIAKDEFYAIGTVLPVGNYGVVKENFHNVPEPMPASWMYPEPGPTRPEQYFVS